MSKETLLRNKGKDAKDPSIPKDGKDAKDPSIPIKPLEGNKPYKRRTKKEYIDSPSGAGSLFENSKTKP